MKIAFLTILTFFLAFQTPNCDEKKTRNLENAGTPTPTKTMKYERLPDNVKPDAQVLKQIRNDRGEVISNEVTTVEKRLNELKARYEKDKLVDEKGREIRFFELLCRGVSAGEEQDEIDRLAKEKELAELEKKYTVIVLPCDPGKVM